MTCQELMDSSSWKYVCSNCITRILQEDKETNFLYSGVMFNSSLQFRINKNFPWMFAMYFMFLFLPSHLSLSRKTQGSLILSCCQAEYNSWLLVFSSAGHLDDSSLPYHHFLGHNVNITVFHILTVWKCFENGHGFKRYLMLSVWWSETNPHKIT